VSIRKPLFQGNADTIIGVIFRYTSGVCGLPLRLESIMSFSPDSRYSNPSDTIICPLMSLLSGGGEFNPCQDKEVVGDNATQNISFKSFPARPCAAVKAKGSFESGDACLNAGTEVPELFVNPGALRHLQDRKPAFSGKDGILYVVLFSIDNVVL
jgi:hypothetical protein